MEMAAFDGVMDEGTVYINHYNTTPYMFYGKELMVKLMLFWYIYICLKPGFDLGSGMIIVQ